MTPSVVKGIRIMNDDIKENTQWFMLEIFDGFGDHLVLLPEMAHIFKNK